MSNRDFPYGYRPDRSPEGRSGGFPGPGSSVPSRPGSPDGYAAASQAGGRGIDGLPGYGRGSAQPGSGGRSGGQHSNRSSRGALRGGGRSPGRGGAAASGRSGGVREDVYPPGRDVPGQGGRPGRGGGIRDGSESPWGERGTATRSRGTSRFGTGVRDIRDDLRERLRRNGVSGDWDEPDGARRRAGNGGGDWDGPGGPGGREPRPKGSWWRHWSWKKVLTLAAAAFGVFIIVAAAGVAYAYSKTPIPNPQASVFVQASKVYFSDGKTEVGQFGQTNRVILQYNQIPVVMRNAVVAAEDKNFWHEGGISPTGILRAAYYDLTSSGGGNLQGGSTITQQLVRNYYDGIGTSQTMSRKIKEIFVAEKLAHVESKEWILQQYLNTVLFGGNVYGVGAAEQFYFGLDAHHLNQITPAQAAMIAAMIQSPNGYSPDPKAGAAYTGLVNRWKYVLGEMKNMGTLSPQAYAQALSKFPTVAPPPNLNWNGYRGYIMQAVQNELLNTYHYSQQRINTGGLHVVTTVNKNLMNRLYGTVRATDALMRHCAPPALLAGSAPASCKGLPRYVHAGAL
ncbi:MAG TPA: biosynthetic peptidoglycan transglycosylase, partial [Streptosporangiaceae bacterium]|nr:biosynthetic peptidoglycan transglycosylase [Streptosporangiaceae bacterium]